MMTMGQSLSCGHLAMLMNFVERDKWYYVVDCQRCERGLVLREAPAAEDVASPALAALPWKCPQCGTRQIVHRGQVERCQGIYL